VPSRRRATRRNLSNSLGDMTRRLRYLEARPSYSSLSNHVVQRQNIQPRSVSTDQIALSSITNTLIEAETIRASELSEDSVGNSELQPSSVDTENFVTGSIDNNAIQDDAVETRNIQDGSVTEDKLEGDSVTTDKIADGAVTESKIDDGAVTEPKISSGAVTESKIGNGAVTGSKIATNAVTAIKIATNAVTAVKILDGAVTSAKIGTDAVTSTKIGAGAVSEVKIATFAVTNTKIGSGAITSAKIADSAFGTGSNQIPRGNHTHPINISNFLESTSEVSGLGAHRHTVIGINVPGNTGTPSTQRVKRDISDYNISDPQKILNLQPKKYKYKNSLRTEHTGKNREWLYGYIAEEVLDLGLEEIVGYDRKGRPNSLDYSLISLFLVELAKVHENEINSLKEEIQRLKEEK